jgi:hypothetical protein
VHAWIDTIIELAILIILIIEYRYDKNLNEHVKHMKHRAKKRFEFENLTQGEHK